MIYETYLFSLKKASTEKTDEYTNLFY